VTLDTNDLLPLVPASGLQNVYFVTIAYWVGAAVDSSTDPAMVKFTQEFQAKFGKFPEQTNAPTAYLFFKAIFAALNQSGVTDAASAVAAINAEKDQQLPGAVLHGWRDGYAVWNGVRHCQGRLAYWRTALAFTNRVSLCPTMLRRLPLTLPRRTIRSPAFRSGGWSAVSAV
jgi:hypothetical protein